MKGNVALSTDPLEVVSGFIYLLNNPDEFGNVLDKSYHASQEVSLSDFMASKTARNEAPLPNVIFSKDAEVVLPQAHTASQLYGVERIDGIELEAAGPGIEPISRLFTRWLKLMPNGKHTSHQTDPSLPKPTVMKVSGGRYRITATHIATWKWTSCFDTGNSYDGAETHSHLEIGDTVELKIVSTLELEGGKILSYCPTFDNRLIRKLETKTTNCTSDIQACRGRTKELISKFSTITSSNKYSTSSLMSQISYQRRKRNNARRKKFAVTDAERSYTGTTSQDQIIVKKPVTTMKEEESLFSTSHSTSVKEQVKKLDSSQGIQGDIDKAAKISESSKTEGHSAQQSSSAVPRTPAQTEKSQPPLAKDQYTVCPSGDDDTDNKRNSPTTPKAKMCLSLPTLVTPTTCTEQSALKQPILITPTTEASSCLSSPSLSPNQNSNNDIDDENSMHDLIKEEWKDLSKFNPIIIDNYKDVIVRVRKIVADNDVHKSTSAPDEFLDLSTEKAQETAQSKLMINRETVAICSKTDNELQCSEETVVDCNRKQLQPAISLPVANCNKNKKQTSDETSKPRKRKLKLQQRHKRRLEKKLFSTNCNDNESQVRSDDDDNDDDSNDSQDSHGTETGSDIGPVYRETDEKSIRQREFIYGSSKAVFQALLHEAVVERHCRVAAFT